MILDPKHKIIDLAFEEIIDHGFREPEYNPKDYVALGATKVPDQILRPKGQWLDIKITKEYQKRNGLESFGCTGFGTNNAVEILHKFKYPEDKEMNNSDRCINIVANNTHQGNNPNNPAESLRKIGVCKESSLPFDETIDTWEKFYSPKPLTQELLKECADWKARYEFLHDWVNPSKRNLMDYLKRSPLGISVRAWKMRNGLYYKNVGERDNHWVVLIGYKKNKFWYIFDSYDGFVKKLEWDYDFKYCKRYYLKKIKENKPILINEDMLKTIKFETDPRIFIQNPVDTKRIIWIQDADGTSEVDWKVLKEENLIIPQPQILPDTSFPQYTIVNWNINGDLTDDLNISIFSAIFKKITGIFRKK
ncbi:MAG: hypothetical protein ACTSPI_11080 [Candidatus Heimdallarchaeaceae archaeon]